MATLRRALSGFALYLSTCDILGFTDGNGKALTCSYVSNSGSLLGSKLGQEIDSHDSVFRFNYATTRELETDVGRRTDIRILGWWKDVNGITGTYEFWKLHGKKLQLALNITQEKVIVVRGERLPSDFMFRQQPSRRVHITRLAEAPTLRLPDELCMGKCPSFGSWSSGFWGLFSLPLFCEQAWAYGFKTSPHRPQHFFEGKSMSERAAHKKAPHPFRLEKLILEKLSLNHSQRMQTAVHELNLKLIWSHALHSLEEWDVLGH